MFKSELKKLQQGQQELKDLLAEINEPKTQATWYTNEDLMEQLKVSRRTLSNWRDQGLIGFSKINGKIFYSHSDVEEFMANNYREPFNKERRQYA